MKKLTLNSRLLAIIGRRVPAIYDAVIPRYYGPLPDPWARLAAVGLNPQPLPPDPPPDQLGAAIASEFVRTAWLSGLFGRDQGRVFAELDDWCPTRPKRPKLPPWWPPIPEPEPHPDWYIDFHLGFIARLAAVSVEDTRLGESIDKAIDRSIKAIESAAAAKSR
jgi:hypothetical protein